jgi:hypothetical protein
MSLLDANIQDGVGEQEVPKEVARRKPGEFSHGN